MNSPWHVILDQSPAITFSVVLRYVLRVKNAGALNIDPLPLSECSAYCFIYDLPLSVIHCIFSDHFHKEMREVK